MTYRAEITRSGQGWVVKWAIVYFRPGFATPARIQYALSRAGAQRKARKHLVHLNATI